MLLTSLRPRAAGVVGVGAVTRLPSGDDVMKPWARQLVARLNIKHQRIWGANHAHQMEAFQTDEQITPIKRRTAAGRVRHRPRSFEDRGGRSPLIIKDLDLYPQPLTTNRSPTLNSEELDLA